MVAGETASVRKVLREPGAAGGIRRADPESGGEPARAQTEAETRSLNGSPGRDEPRAVNRSRQPPGRSDHPLLTIRSGFWSDRLTELPNQLIYWQQRPELDPGRAPRP